MQENFLIYRRTKMILTTIEVPEDYWESTSTNNENFEFIYNEKELGDIYI